MIESDERHTYMQMLHNKFAFILLSLIVNALYEHEKHNDFAILFDFCCKGHISFRFALKSSSNLK